LASPLARAVTATPHVAKEAAMKRSLASALVLGLACSAFLVSPALGDQPTRETLPPPPGTVVPLTSGECPFAAEITVLSNKAAGLTFTSGARIITGQFFLRVTNLETGQSVDFNASGPGFTAVGATTVELSGSSLLFLPAGALGPGSAGVVWLTRGPVLLDFGGPYLTVTFTAAHASVRDICAELAS
jgi:hypothetical protein